MRSSTQKYSIWCPLTTYNYIIGKRASGHAEPTSIRLRKHVQLRRSRLNGRKTSTNVIKSPTHSKTAYSASLQA